MKTYSVCVVSREYRYVEVEAEDESAAKDKVWDKVACGFTSDTKATDYDTELYVEGEVPDGLA